MSRTLGLSVAALAFAFTFASLALLVAGDDRSYSADDMRIDFLGNSGKIKVYTAADANDFIQISQSKLEEVDSSGNNVNGRSVNLASSISNAGWSTPVVVHQTDGIVYASTKFTSYITLSNPTTVAVFELLARVYRNATTVQNGNDPIAVYRNSVKFDVNITNWPAFGASTNTLNYEIELDSKGGNSGPGSMSSRGNGGRDKRVALVNGLMDTPGTATVDGVANTAIGVTITSRSSKQFVAFAFPAFARSVQYDPIVCVGCPASGAVASATASLTLVVAAVLMAVATQFRS